MDVSKQYITVCDCPEIQDKRPEDWFTSHRNIVAGDKNKQGYIWLPRIDQLIDMFPDGALEMDIFRTDLGEWQIQGADYYSTGYLKSLEQALLCFVMHELHQKKWTEEEWINA